MGRADLKHDADSSMHNDDIAALEVFFEVHHTTF